MKKIEKIEILHTILKGTDELSPKVRYIWKIVRSLILEIYGEKAVKLLSKNRTNPKQLLKKLEKRREDLELEQVSNNWNY